MAAVTDRSREIARTGELLKAFRGKRELFNSESDVLELCKTRYGLVYGQIHGWLADKRDEKSESEIQGLVKDVFANDLPICVAKVRKFQDALKTYESRGDKANVEKCYRYLQEWLQLYEDNYALVAFRSLEHFANFMEWDRADSEKVWKYSIDPMEDGGYTGVNYPFFYYFNQMVLKKNVKFISKQQATGTGKSYSNIVAISWLLGINPENDVLLVLGNPSLVLMNTRGITNMMSSERFAKVFPRFQKYQDAGDVKNAIFSVCRQKEGELTLADSSKAINVKVISKDTSIDGIRVRFLFLDDVCRSKDAGNMKQHDTDIANYFNSWWKRNYNSDDFYVIVGGTAYSIFDILSYLKNYYSKGKVKRSPINKYTTLSLDDKYVFIAVPALDPDTDESTYPQKFSTQDKRDIRARDYRTYMAMENQTPLAPENSPFYMENLQMYDVFPEEYATEPCLAALDSARIGFDYNSMPIFVNIDGKYYLKDTLYLNEPMDNVYPKICDKIEEHRIVKLVIEKNIDVSLKAMLTKMLNERGIYYCEIMEVYATVKKEEKIYNMEQTIKSRIVFPSNQLYHYSSQMGKFMNDVFAFSYVHKNDHDDSIDSLATFCQRIIVQPETRSRSELLYV